MNADPVALAAHLEEIVGRGALSAGEDHLAPYVVDGVRPGLIVRPGTQEDVSRVVAACAAAGATMIPWGGGTAMGLGNPPTGADVLIQMDRLDRIVEWDPANLCITAEAGMRLGALQQLIARDGAVLPLDPPSGQLVTLGGLVAANQAGPGRLLHGTVRDWLLGMRVVLPDGERIHCGGRVLKNVTGYDMNKLFIRSLGTLGIVTEVTFKLLPAPAQRAGVLGLFPTAAQAWTAVRRTLASFLLPEAMDFLNPEAVALLSPGLILSGSGCALAVALAGSPETVARQTRDFEALFLDCGGTVTHLPDGRALQAWDQIRDLMDGVRASSPARTLCKLSVPIGRTGEFVASAEGVATQCGLKGIVAAHAGSGIIWALYLPSAGSDPENEVASSLEDLRREAVAAGGNLVLQDAPLAIKQLLDAWGEAGTGLDLMRRLKQEFDPRGLCNPGRFVGGI